MPDSAPQPPATGPGPLSPSEAKAAARRSARRRIRKSLRQIRKSGREIRRSSLAIGRSAYRLAVPRPPAELPTPPAPPPPPPPEHPHADVLVYFADGPSNLYQMTQWLPVFERLAQRRSLAILTRSQQTYDILTELTTLRTVRAPDANVMVEMYADDDAKVILYVNNGAQNFLSLANFRALHVHIGHGESDKHSMASHQAKAYDRVFVAGPAALERYRAAFLSFDESTFSVIGRPQLDLRPEPVVPPSPSGRRSLLYAPTWESGWANNYTSVQVYGEAIVAAALAVPGTRVLYKPHPRLTKVNTAPVREAHERMVATLQAAQIADPAAGHWIDDPEAPADILAVFPSADLMITDVSSVGIDFLYRHVDRPMVLTDRYNDRAALAARTAISACADVLDDSALPGLTDLLSARLTDDPLAAQRQTARAGYFGDLPPGASTALFVDAVDALAEERDRLVAGRGASIRLAAVSS